MNQEPWRVREDYTEGERLYDIATAKLQVVEEFGVTVAILLAAIIGAKWSWWLFVPAAFLGYKLITWGPRKAHAAADKRWLADKQAAEEAGRFNEDRSELYAHRGVLRNLISTLHDLTYTRGALLQHEDAELLHKRLARQVALAVESQPRPGSSPADEQEHSHCKSLQVQLYEEAAEALGLPKLRKPVHLGDLK